MKAILPLLLTGVLLVSGLSAFGQRCGDEAYKNLLLQRNPDREKLPAFENWIREKIQTKQLQTQGTQRTQSTTYTIPVVFHVIHNGASDPTNIPDTQIQSQINVLNKDFKRLNADAANTPAIFQAVAGSIDIEFVLAKQTPEGLPTNGINRVQGTKTSWRLSDDATMKALSYWPSEDYLNIWVINLVDPSNLVGYAQFPVSALPGLEDSSNDALTDGVVLHYEVVGSVDDGTFNLENNFNKGRTATHEVGHFLGLRHIWGDGGGCSSTDYVDDTPIQSGSTTGCPTHPQTSCSNTKMFQNYMDYTNDACMNLYTMGQVARMDVVLQNSPRRASLTTSLGASEPIPVANDLGIKDIVMPGITSCGGSVVPSVELRNYGDNTVTSAQVAIKINGVVIETKSFDLSLAPLQSSIASFAAVTLNSPSTSTVEFEILQTNGGADGKVANNTITRTTKVPYRDTLPLSEGFNSLPSKWDVQNPDGQTTWAIRNAPQQSPTNNAIFLSMHDYENEGTFDRLVSPVFDFTGVTAATFLFDRAYAKFPGIDTDQLRVVITTDCSSDFDTGVEILNKSGSELSTTANTQNFFIPSSAGQWATESISLGQFAGQPNVQVAFIAQNGYGNNLYLDNVLLLTGAFTDVALIAINSPGAVISKSNPAPVIQIKNFGSDALNDLTVVTTVNGMQANQSFNNLNLATGQETALTLNPVNLSLGINELQIEVINPNGQLDGSADNNVLSRKVVLNSDFESIPTRQKFETNFFGSWTPVAQGSFEWEIAATINKGQSMVARAFTNPNVGEEAWLVSPVLDFSDAQEGSLFFDVSYGLSNQGADRLQVLSSLDGGETYNEIEYEQSGNQLAIANNNTAWQPLTDADWKREYVNLNNLAGQSSVRLAFVATNDNGNNVFIDNIELYNDDNPDPPVIESIFDIYTVGAEIKITFNLSNKDVVRLQVYNTVGQVLVDNQLGDTLNQTYSIDMSQQQTGIYIVRLQFDNAVSATKVFMAN
ncbi:MAG: M43 family zinc metalloprotease [Cyclobacteriaceae bacterium]